PPDGVPGPAGAAGPAGAPGPAGASGAPDAWRPACGGRAPSGRCGSGGPGRSRGVMAQKLPARSVRFRHVSPVRPIESGPGPRVNLPATASVSAGWRRRAGARRR
ncbi:hypothetical protein F9B16_29955, partial [Actinomadura montaniterrae]